MNINIKIKTWKYYRVTILILKFTSGKGNLIFCCTGPTDPNFRQIKVIILISHINTFFHYFLLIWFFPFDSKMSNKTYLLKTRNNLKPAETSWNNPETTWNHQPFYSIFLRKISYSQVMFVLIPHPKVFFWETLVPKTQVLQFDRNLVQGYIAICLLQV